MRSAWQQTHDLKRMTAVSGPIEKRSDSNSTQSPANSYGVLANHFSWTRRFHQVAVPFPVNGAGGGGGLDRAPVFEKPIESNKLDKQPPKEKRRKQPDSKETKRAPASSKKTATSIKEAF